MNLSFSNRGTISRSRSCFAFDKVLSTIEIESVSGTVFLVLDHTSAFGHGFAIVDDDCFWSSCVSCC